MLETLLLSRIQFGFTIGFHILFPTLNLGLALFLTIIEALYLKTKKHYYLVIAKFWTKIFALTFGMGVVSGIVLSYELGTNFAGFTNAVGGVLGALFTYEVLSAFFLEAGFLGVMLFGWNKVGPKLHFAATALVMIGTTISAFWIMAANSWMQTPAGFRIEDGIFVVTSWWDVIFNPSFPERFVHMMFAAYFTTVFVIAGVSAWYLLKRRHLGIAKRMLRFALVAALIIVPAQIIMGDLVGLEVYENQPVKTAAMEANWQTGKGKPLILFAIPDQAQQKNHYEVAIPKLASLINTHSLDGTLPGLNSVSVSDQPRVAPVFFSFRVMVGIAFMMLAVAGYGLWLLYRKRLYSSKVFLRICVACAPLGFIATLAGWLTAELGRQPWVVYNLLRTSESVSAIPVEQVIISLSLFIIVYGVIFSFYLYYLFKMIRLGPKYTVLKPKTETTLFQYMAKEGDK